MSNAVKKALNLIELVAAGNESLGALAKAAGMPKSTVHRLAATLVDEGFLVRDDTGYRLGYRLLELGHMIREQNYLVAAAREPMRRLSELTSETVHLGELDGTHIVFLEKVAGNRGITMASRIGLRNLAQVTALGKVMISHRPETEWPAHLVDGIERRTPYTIVSLRELVEELRHVRTVGYALDREENELGIRCVAAPIRDYAGRVVAAVSISGASVYVTEERQLELVEDIRATAREISRQLGGEAFFEEGGAAVASRVS